MGDWDPFAVDDAEPSAAVGLVTAKDKEQVKKKQAKKGLSDAEEQEVVEHLADMLIKTEGWRTHNVMQVDLKWNQPTCDSSDWRHIDVKFEVSDGIAYVILNRPKENNSLNDTIGAGVVDALFALHRRPDIRIAVFTGEGPMYCAGGDPKNWQAGAAALRGEKIDGDGTVGNRIQLASQGPEVASHIGVVQMRGLFSGAFGKVKWYEVPYGQISAAKQWHTWVNLPQFSICLVNGSAMGGGVGMVCMCDYAIAVKKAFFVVSEVRIGVIPATISPYVCAKIGASAAKRMFNTAKQMKAGEDAKSTGIVNEVVENMKEGHARVGAIAEEMKQCSPSALFAAKQLAFNVAGQPIMESVMFYTALKAKHNLVDPECIKGRECESTGEKKPWELTKITPLY